MEQLVKRLHITIPTGLFDVIYRHKDMDNIDNIIINLLCEHYGVDLNGRNKR